MTTAKISWMELHEKEINIPFSVEEGTTDEDDARDFVLDASGAGDKDSCIHYEIHDISLEHNTK